MLGVLRVTAWVASVVSLVLAIVLAILVYGMPLGQALLAGTEGAAFGFYPVDRDQRDLGLPNDRRDRTFRCAAALGVLGKMISPQNLAIAAAAVGMNGKEGDIFRRVIVWSVVFLALLCVLSGLQASVLSWMVP
jgi:L-lactate permease